MPTALSSTTFDPRMDQPFPTFAAGLATEACGDTVFDQQSVTDATNFINNNGGDTPQGRYNLYQSWVQQGYVKNTSPPSYVKVLGVVPHQYLWLVIMGGIGAAVLIAILVWRLSSNGEGKKNKTRELYY